MINTKAQKESLISITSMLVTICNVFVIMANNFVTIWKLCCTNGLSKCQSFGNINHNK